MTSMLTLDVVEMIMAMESEFSSDGNDLEISDEEAEGIITVADALKFLDEKKYLTKFNNNL